ncbi:MAG: BamA/TamA family outer membrane protein [Verrucomicrobia bacterium]|nr:BamA/TamA family outer membrane protein [Verrucomicrobiota bacterium]
MWKKLFFLSLVPVALWAANVPYSVYFLGLDDKEALKTLKAVSDLTTLRSRPPTSLNALRYRADSDTADLLKVLHSYGYYEATIDIRLEEYDDETRVYVLIQPGPMYTLGEFSVQQSTDCAPITAENVGLRLGKQALAKEILNAEQKTLTLLANCGYPLAKIDKREMIADGDTKQLLVRLSVEAGPLCRFGPLSIQGLAQVEPKYIQNNQEWKEGDTYAASKVETTQKSLLESGLFSSALITHAEKPDSKGELPMRLEVSESKHRSIHAGISYQTFFGPGLTFGWENRNIQGMGRKLSLRADVTKRTHAGNVTFLVPDAFRPNQDYVAAAQAMYESIFPYHQRSYSVTNRLEWKIGTEYRVSMGLKLERIIVGDSADNGTFTLGEGPIYFRWSSADDLLNPTRGQTIEYKIVPSINFADINRYYVYQSAAYATYWGLHKSDGLVLAHQILLESIYSQNLGAIPMPKRVLGGSDQELRGYRYRSVSPFEGDKPEGGRCGLFYTAEMRLRFSKSLGFVPFFDIGNVEKTILPKGNEKWFKSAGLGVRYFTFLGPLRFDIAFPLNRRKGIDPYYRVLVSIGQTF